MTDTAPVTTIETRVRGMTAARLNTAGTVLAAYLTAQAAGGPDITTVLSKPAVYLAITRILDSLRDNVIDTVRAGYAASARIARDQLAAQLATHGYVIPDGLPDLGGYLDAVIADIRAAVANVPLDLGETLRASDTISETLDRNRTIPVAVDRVMRRLGVHLNSAAVSAVHRGHSDATVAILRVHAVQHPGMTVTKTWRTTSSSPCPACAALNGSTVAVTDEFDRNATTATPLKVYRDLQGPPRHPNCRCKLEYSTSPATAAYRRTVAAPAPVDSTTLSAADIRRMPSATYQQLTRYLSRALTRLRTLYSRIRRGK